MDASLFFVGTATTLIRACGFTVLTDPSFLHAGERAHLGYGLTSRRLTEPAIGTADLPALDVVVLSHVHGDHWDRRARAGLDRGVPVVTTHASAKALRRQGFAGARGLARWGTRRMEKDGASLTITATPARHASGVLGALLPDVNGHVLELSDGSSPGGAPDLRVWLSGDTLVFFGIDQVAQRFPDLDVGVLHLGGTRLPAGLPIGPMVTLDGEGGAEVVDRVRPRAVVPVHCDDFTVFTSPRSAFVDALARRGLADRLLLVERGQTVALPTRG